MGGDIMNKGLTKARCVRRQKAKGKSLTSARRACNVKGTYKGERRRTGKKAFSTGSYKMEITIFGDIPVPRKRRS